MASTRGEATGILAIVLASFLWGTTGTAASFAPEVSALAIGAFAMGMGGIFLVLSALKPLLNDRHKLISNPYLLVAGGLSVAVYPLAFYSSMRLSGVAIGTVVSIASAPLFTMMLECLLGRKRVSLQWMLSMLTGALGILLLAMGKAPALLHDDNSAAGHALANSMGIALGLLAGISYATYSWAAKRMIERQIHSKSAMAAMFGLAAMLLLPSLMLTGGELFTTVTNAGVALYMALVPMFLGYLCFSYGLRYLEASKATLITLLEPVAAMLLAVLVLGERFLAVGWVGMVMILLCLALQSVRLPVSQAGTIDMAEMSDQ